MTHPLWRKHPHVRAGGDLTLGERAADRLRNGMGSWLFVFGSLLFLGVWMAFNGGHGFDRYPFILLNLMLSCLAALQGAILLIAAKRADQVAAELAAGHYMETATLDELVKSNTTLTEQVHELLQKNTQLTEQIRELLAAKGGTS